MYKVSLGISEPIWFNEIVFLPLIVMLILVTFLRRQLREIAQTINL